MPVTHRDFYELFPDGYHATGDIWLRLPSFGLIKANTITGLVVTPACDLAHCKTETVTYVPIVPMRLFLQLPEFLAEVARSLSDLMERIDIRIDPLSLVRRAHTLSQEFTPLIREKAKPDVEKRCLAAIDYLEQSRHFRLPEGGKPDPLEAILGASSWRKIREKLVRNSYRSDIYYLPPDHQASEWSPIPGHSVALLRYLITVPTRFLDEANASDRRDWGARRQTMIDERLHWCVDCDADTPPLRALRLRDAFLSDLLTKLVSIYVRIGAPDIDHAILTRTEQEL